MQLNKTNNLQSGIFFLKVTMVVFFSMLFIATYITLRLANQGYEGVMEKNYYEKGLNFEQELETQRHITSLGYEMKIEIIEKEKSEQREIKIKLTKNNLNIDFESKIKVLLEKPATSKYNSIIELNSISKGNYIGQFNLPFKGIWIITIIGKLPDGILEKRKKIEVI